MLCTFAVFLTNNQVVAKEKSKAVLGEWLYKVSEVPGEYENGLLIFSEKNEKTVCQVKLASGELNVNNLVIDKMNIHFSTSIEGNQILVKLKLENNKLSGTVDTPDGQKEISAVKKE